MGDKRQKNNDKYEDITSYSKPKGITKGLSHFMRYKFKPFFLRNHKRNLKALLSIVICLVLVFSALGGAYIRKIQTRLRVFCKLKFLFASAKRLLKRSGAKCFRVIVKALRAL